jgi:hypothetical protein
VDQPYSGPVHKRTAINMDNSGPVDQRTASLLNIHSVKVHKHTARNMDPVLIQCISALPETRTPFLSSASGVLLLLEQVHGRFSGPRDLCTGRNMTGIKTKIWPPFLSSASAHS